MSDHEDALKLFAMTSQLLEHDLDQVEVEHGIDLRRDHHSTAQLDEAYYPQIESEIRAEAAMMAPHYEVFYSLETTIRRLVRDQLLAEQDDWWSQRVPEQIRKDAEKRQQREVDTGITPRSDDPMDFLTFGELSDIIKANWDVFGAVFSSAKAVERVMSALNTLRGPIAHCSPLAEDEVLRLRLAVRDWFRLGE
jgi:HEPN superfamily Swt1-like protein